MATFTANNGSAWMKDQEQLKDKKLLERYKAGERDFCNFKLHNWMLEKIGSTYLNSNEPADLLKKLLKQPTLFLMEIKILIISQMVYYCEWIYIDFLINTY